MIENGCEIRAIYWNGLKANKMLQIKHVRVVQQESKEVRCPQKLKKHTLRGKVKYWEFKYYPQLKTIGTFTQVGPNSTTRMKMICSTCNRPITSRMPIQGLETQ